jgi:hypothetical protein
VGTAINIELIKTTARVQFLPLPKQTGPVLVPRFQSWPAHPCRIDPGSRRSSRGPGFNCRKLDPKAASNAQMRLEADSAAHALNRLADHGQAEAISGIFAIGVQPLEKAEDTVLVFRRDADAVVDHPQPHLARQSLTSSAWDRNARRNRSCSSGATRSLSP